MIDLAALHDLAARSLSREALKAAGYWSLYHSSDLFAWGYRVRHWLRARPPCEVLEYLPRQVIRPDESVRDIRRGRLPRVTVSNYADQVSVHRALGLEIVPPGEQWQAKEHRQSWLFDATHCPDESEAA